MSASEIKPRALATGLVSFVPGMRRLMNRASGGTDSSRYCYAVWMRHLVRAATAGVPPDPGCVAELGPGDSLGVGIAAILSGARRYIALDAKAHANRPRNLEVFEELVDLFGARAAIPDDQELPAVQPKLADYRFPKQLLTESRLADSLAASRLRELRAAVQRGRGDGSDGIGIEYIAPWNDPAVIRKASVDFLFSQAVLEHIDDVDGAYRAMRVWMRLDGYMSHTVDFRSHDLTRSWNGHWALGDRAWRIVRGRRSYLINREPLSFHLALLTKYRFEVVGLDRRTGQLDPTFRAAKRFRSLNMDDLSTSGAFIQARAT